MFDRTLVFLPQMEDAGVEIAKRFGAPFAGTPDNLGILGGFKALAQALTDTIVLAENDYILVEPREEAERQLAVARRRVEAGDAHVWRLRHRWRPGESWGFDKVRVYWPPASASTAARRAAAARRLLRPRKAESLVGRIAFIDEAPERRFPDDFRRTEEGDLLIRSRALPWANNVFMVRPRVLSQHRHPSGRSPCARPSRQWFPLDRNRAQPRLVATPGLLDRPRARFVHASTPGESRLLTSDAAHRSSTKNQD